MPYHCRLCRKEFQSASALGGHVNVVHAHPLHDQQAARKLWADPARVAKQQEALRKAMVLRDAPLAEFRLTKQQESLILGGLLGDLHIGLPNKRSANARAEVSHSSKQYEYAMWKYFALKDIVRKEPRLVPNGGFGDVLVRFNTRCLPCLTEVYHLVTVGGRKTVNERWLSRVTDPLSLAVWAMDDGSAGANMFAFHLGKVSQEEGTLLKDWLWRNWRLFARLYSRRRERIICIMRNDNLPRLKELIAPHIIDSMKYKPAFTT